jgi:hypothetical protein
VRDQLPRGPVRRRRRVGGPRRRQVVVRLSDDEFEAIRRTAETAGLALGAWVGDAAARSADRSEWELGTSRSEVVRQLVRVRLDVAFARQVALEAEPGVGEAAARPLDAVLARLDELIDRAVQDSE